ncbi:MAG: DUF3847 domain-containing protein [Clostridia bacterium]
MKTILEQIEETRQTIEKCEIKHTQLSHQKDKLITQHNSSERKKRTRRLIEKGAILESTKLKDLSNEQLKNVLNLILHTEQAQGILNEFTEQAPNVLDEITKDEEQA